MIPITRPKTVDLTSLPLKQPTGKVELLEYFGNDAMIARVARVSFDKDSYIQEETKDEKLIRYLVREKHFSPLRHPQLQFRIQCPIFVERQLFTHQVGFARNSISGRYVDFSDSYWEPEQLRYQSTDSKQGSAGDLSEENNTYFLEKIAALRVLAQELYKEMSDFGVAKELCRTHLPLSLETKFIWTCSFQAFTHLCGLRLKPDAQLETRNVVHRMLQCVEELEDQPFKFALAACNLSSIS